MRLFNMIVLNCLKYDWNHFKKGKYSKVQHASLSYRLHYENIIISVCLGHGFLCFCNQALSLSLSLSKKKNFI